MNVNRGAFRVAVAAVMFGVGGATGCTTDDDDPGVKTGGAGTSGGAGTTGGAGTGGNVGTGGMGGTGTSTAACVSPYAVPAGSPVVFDFDAYDGVSDLGKWSAPLGGDPAAGVYAGPFSYGDRATGFPETFNAVEGQASKYALRIADTLAEKYGGGMGTWLSGCLNATQFAGFSFWVKGNLPMGKGTLTVSMMETLSSTPAKAGDKVGTCTGTATTCVHPTYLFNVTDTWTKVQVPWSSFTAGSAAGTAVTPNGRNITQLQFGVGLNWVSDASGAYVPVPAPYELVVDTLAFY